MSVYTALVDIRFGRRCCCCFCCCVVVVIVVTLAYFTGFSFSAGLHQIGLERQGQRMGHTAAGRVGQWAWSRLLWLSAGADTRGAAESSQVSERNCVSVCLIEQLQGQLWWQVLLTDSQKFHFPQCSFSLSLPPWQIRMVYRAGPALVCPACGLIDALRCGWHTVYGDHIQRLVHVNGDWFPEFMWHKSSQYARGKLPTLKY